MKVKIDDVGSHYALIGHTDDILRNDRFIISLKRLKCITEKDKILIPYWEENKINILQELQYLLEKFRFETILTEKTQSDVSNFVREQETFKEFSEMARCIRNDEFKGNPVLVGAFNDFQLTLKKILRRRLYPLQLLSAFHMAFSQNGCNFAVPGAGKTSIVYSAYAYLRNLLDDNPKHVDKILVIGPLSSFAPWENEYRKCFGTSPQSMRLSGDNKTLRMHKEQHLYSGNPAELTLIFHGGVNTLQNEIISFLKRNKTMVVVDEAHRIKNPEGIWGKSVIDIAREAKSRIVLTGTPVPNGYEDLYNLFQFLYPYKYADILQFHFGDLLDMTENSHPDSERVKQFIHNISPYFVRIKKADLKLPPVKEHVIMVDMDSYQREIYDFIENKYISSFKNDKFAAAKDVLNKARLIRLRQAATNPKLLIKPLMGSLNEEDYESRLYPGKTMPDMFQDDSQIISRIYDYSKTNLPRKFLTIKELLMDTILPTGGKTIIWTIFIQNAKELHEYLNKNEIPSKLLIGEIDQPNREDIIAKFNNPENNDFKVIIANPYAVAESISLHIGCHNAIYLERDYNCANYLQSKDRIHRYGLPPNQETNYYYLISKESIDNVIKDKLTMKVKRMERIIDEDIPLFFRINDSDETDLIKALMDDYAKRS